MTDTNARPGLDELDALLTAATPGPWESVGSRYLRYDNGSSEQVAAVRVNHDAGPWERIYVKRDVDGADAALIVALRNRAADLLAAIRAAYALAERADRHGYDLDPDDLRAALDEALGASGE